MPDPKDARAKIKRLNALTDKLTTQIEALEATPSSVKVEVRSHDVSTEHRDAIAFLVVLHPSRAAEKKLKDVAAQLDAVSANKREVRAALGEPANPGLDLFAAWHVITAFSRLELDRMAGRAKGNLSSLAGMSEMEALRLQMAMERITKVMSTLSNLLKKVSKTSNDVTKNMK